MKTDGDTACRKLAKKKVFVEFVYRENAETCQVLNIELKSGRHVSLTKAQCCTKSAKTWLRFYTIYIEISRRWHLCPSVADRKKMDPKLTLLVLCAEG